jgi:hypothetical protein
MNRLTNYFDNDFNLIKNIGIEKIVEGNQVKEIIMPVMKPIIMVEVLPKEKKGVTRNFLYAR